MESQDVPLYHLLRNQWVLSRYCTDGGKEENHWRQFHALWADDRQLNRVIVDTAEYKEDWEGGHDVQEIFAIVGVQDKGGSGFVVGVNVGVDSLVDEDREDIVDGDNSIDVGYLILYS